MGQFGGIFIIQDVLLDGHKDREAFAGVRKVQAQKTQASDEC